MSARIGQVLFADQNSKAGLAFAKLWIRLQDYTNYDVKLVIRGDQCLVISKRKMELPKRIYQIAPQ